MGVPHAVEGQWPAVLGSAELEQRIKDAKVLVVGAGGIGCELLKTLVLSGFQDIEVVDLDTIETSNLNRQFLFRKHHVGKSKAQVAAEVVAAFAPAARITAHQANIKEARFGLEFVRGKSIVLNGLDNLDARRHVNRLCVAAGTPLVESGTAGHQGQVSVHLKGLTECYECQPRAPQQRTYPICTLRNTPDKPIHCIVWAKELLFARLFGPPEAVTDLDEQSAEDKAEGAPPTEPPPDTAAAASDQGIAGGGGGGGGDASAFVRREGEGAYEYAVRVFNKVYVEDIERVLGMSKLWECRAPPAPLRLDELLPDAGARADAAAAAAAAAGGGGSGSVARALGLGDHQVWSNADAARVLLAAVVAYHEHRSGELGAAAFDKDDALAIDFVTAASNLRAACYGIPRQSAFDAKGMAGNIIHAVATTNAMVAGLLVTEAIKVIAGMPGACTTSFISERVTWTGRRAAPTGVLVSAVPPQPPRPDCIVCGRAQLQLAIDTHATTLRELLDKVVRRRLAVNEACLRCGGFSYEEGGGLEPDEVAENAAKLLLTLARLPGGGLVGGAVLTVEDTSQDFVVEVILHHVDQGDLDAEQHPEGFILSGQLPPAKEPAAEAAGGGGEQPAAAGRKRVRGDADGSSGGGGGEGEPVAGAKRAKPAGAGATGAAGGAAANGGSGAEAAAAGEGGDADVILVSDDDVVL